MRDIDIPRGGSVILTEEIDPGVYRLQAHVVSFSNEALKELAKAVWAMWLSGMSEPGAPDA